MKRFPPFLLILLFTWPLFAQPLNPVEQEKQQQMKAQTDRCRQNITSLGDGIQGPVLPGLRRFLGGCSFTAIDEQDIVMSRIRGLGIDTPLYFANAEEARQRKLQEQRLRGDQLVLTRNLVRFDQSVDPTPAITSSANTLGEAGVRLSGDVKEIMLQLQDTLSTREFLRDPKNQQREGMEDVLQFAWMWDRMVAGPGNCGATRVDSDSEEIRNLMWQRPGRVLAPAQLFFGIKSEEDLSRMNAFKWEQGPHVRYLFNAAGKGFDENWVLAEYDRATGEVRFTHFQKVQRESQPATIGPGQTPEGIAAAIPLNLSLNDGRDQLGVSGWVGASLQTGRTRLPWGESITLPTGVINLAQVQLTQSTGSVRSSQTLTATNKDVNLTNTLVPANTTAWDLQTRASVQTQSGQWSAGGGVRVYNVMLGYDAANNGRDRSVNMTVVDGNNYVKVDKSNRNGGRLTMGRMWDSQKGGVAYSYDSERRSHRVELVVLF